MHMPPHCVGKNATGASSEVPAVAGPGKDSRGDEHGALAAYCLRFSMHGSISTDAASDEPNVANRRHGATATPTHDPGSYCEHSHLTPPARPSAGTERQAGPSPERQTGPSPRQAVARYTGNRPPTRTAAWLRASRADYLVSGKRTDWWWRKMLWGSQSFLACCRRL